MSKFHALTVKEVRKETPNAVSILFDIPKELQEDYSFIAGQYINIKHDFSGKEIRRAYSICSSPKSNEVRVVVKKIPQGVFSTFANDDLKAGVTLEVQTPEGRFTLKPNPQATNNYAAFVAGSGITPVISIIKTVLEEEPNSTFVLVYGNKTVEETIFHKDIHELQQRYMNRFFVHFVYSKAKEAEALFGRIDKAAVNFVLNNKHKEKTFDQYFLCGPEDMINTVSTILKERNVQDEMISFEIFTSNNDGNSPVDIDGVAQVTVLVDDEETTFTMSKKVILLDAILKQGIDAPYSCLGGICSTCMCRVLKGTAEMKKNAILTDEEINEGLILSCQAIVTSDEITVDFDDV